MLRSALASPRLWLFSAILWAGALVLLSSFPSIVPAEDPESPQFVFQIDKILHFGYFMGGAFLFTTHLLLKKGLVARRSERLIFPILLFALIGALDEFHQSCKPNRSGNDPIDWLADFLGAVTGIFLAHRLHPLLLKISASRPRIP